MPKQALVRIDFELLCKLMQFPEGTVIRRVVPGDPRADDCDTCFDVVVEGDSIWAKDQPVYHTKLSRANPQYAVIDFRPEFQSWHLPERPVSGVGDLAEAMERMGA